MKCPTCNATMQLRHSRHGAFYFCPFQYTTCTQKTITKTPVKPTKSKPRFTHAYGEASWEERSKGSPYEGKTCLCGKNDYQIGGGGYCECCGYTAQFRR